MNDNLGVFSPFPIFKFSDKKGNSSDLFTSISSAFLLIHRGGGGETDKAFIG